jgi:peptidoglycan lytic transglycosylase G
MAERGDWFADTEGNLTAPGDGSAPPTDEFGRDDPASLERERRRRERQARRKKPRQPAAQTAQTAVAKPAKALKPAKAGKAAKRPEQPPRAPRRPPPSADGTDGSGPEPGAPRGRFHRRRIIALVLVLVGALLAWFLIALFQPPPFDPGDGTGTVVITVPQGATADDIANLLTDNGVVSNGTLFKLRLKLAGKSDSIQANRYVLAHDMSYGAAIDRLTGRGNTLTVTIPEGEDRFQAAPQVAELGITGDYVAASKSHPGFDPAKYGATNPKSLEGFLFPATYDLDRGTDVNTLIGEQLTAFEQNMAHVDLSYAKSKNLTPYDVLTIASMIDKEVQVPSERPLVAAVIYNRLHRGMPLGIDATTRYEFHNYTGEITQSQLSASSPYNTRTHAGLTPTPIGNPGLAAIQAAARPANVNYLYYVLKAGGGGQHCFAASESEFNQLVAAYQQGRAPANCQS